MGGMPLSGCELHCMPQSLHSPAYDICDAIRQQLRPKRVKLSELATRDRVQQVISDDAALLSTPLQRQLDCRDLHIVARLNFLLACKGA